MYGQPIASASNDGSNLEQHGGNTTAHIDGEQEDGDFNGDGSIDDAPSQIRYDTANSSHSLGVVEAIGSHALFGSDVAPAAAGEAGSDHLTLSFQGEVYVFDSVSPQKVQAVLLLLGGCEVPTAIPTIGIAPQNHGNLGEYPGRSSQPQRAASLNRFREKRKERCFDKKIRYTVRKEVALRMQRKKGQFTSSKSVSDEPSSSSADWNGNSGQEEQETLCRHCGISSKSTPMMRRGPDGPRTLCNACGLKWANKGVLRDISKVPIVGMQHQATKASEVVRDLSVSEFGIITSISRELNGQANGKGAAIPAANAITTSNGDN